MSFYLQHLNAYLAWTDYYSYNVVADDHNSPKYYCQTILQTRQAVIFAKGYNSARYIIAELWDVEPDMVKLTIVDLHSSKI